MKRVNTTPFGSASLLKNTEKKYPVPCFVLPPVTFRKRNVENGCGIDMKITKLHLICF